MQLDGHTKLPSLTDRANPFVDHVFDGRGEWLRFVLLAPLLVAQCAIGLSLLATHAFWSGTLALCLGTATLYGCYRPLCWLVCRGMLWTAGVCIEVNGRDEFNAAVATGGAFVVVANHQNLLDPFAVGAAVGPFSPVVKANMASWPFFGTLVRAWKGVFVGRGRGAEADAINRDLDLETRCRLGGIGTDSPPLMVFPEGTCTNGEHVLTFRHGAFAARAPILPIALRWSLGAKLGPGFVHPHSSVALLLLRIMARCGPKRVTITVLPLHVPSAAEVADASGATLARAVERTLATALAVPVSPYTNRDARAFYASLDSQYVARET